LPVFLLGAFLLLAGNTIVGAQWTEDVDAALERADSEDLPVLVFVTGGAWCDPCTWMEDNSFTSPELRTRLSETWVAVRIPDTDPAWQRWEIERLPTVLYLDSQGEELQRTVGAVTADSIIRTMNDVRRELETTAGSDSEEDDSAEGDAAEDAVTGLQKGIRYQIRSGSIWNDGGALWFTEDAGLPPRLEEYDRDAAFLYLRDGSSGTILAITVAEDVQPSLWRWNQNERRWIELGVLEPVE
jgi:hypothetical protein